MERYWSGGLRSPESTEPTVDVFVDGDGISLGFFDPAGAKGLVPVTRVDAGKLVQMLAEAVRKAYAWDGAAEALRSDEPMPTTTTPSLVDELARLRNENAALRQHVAELEYSQKTLQTANAETKALLHAALDREEEAKYQRKKALSDGKEIAEERDRLQALLNEAKAAITPFAVFPYEKASGKIMPFYYDFARTVHAKLSAAVLINSKSTPRPTIVCLCGSTRFSEAYQRANLDETLAGHIVLTIGCDMRSDADVFTGKSEAELTQIKDGLDALHLHKIELADEILVLNVDGYVGTSTAREIAHARQIGKRVRWLEPDKAVISE